MTNKQKKEKKLTFLNHLLAPTKDVYKILYTSLLQRF